VDLSVLMGRLARALQQEHACVEDTLQAITAAAVCEVPGARHAGVSLVTGRRSVRSRAATDPIVEQLDGMQTDLGEGPSLNSIWQQHTVRCDDMTSERRWPRFAAAAQERGIASSLSVQLFVAEDNLGALNLYSDTPMAFDEASEDVGLIFAAHAAVALVGAQREAQLLQALLSRDLIGQAKGILMERYKITGDKAFLFLARLSQDTNTKLHDIAEEIIDTVQESG
jgi:GAF domain-containing protein